MADAQTERRMQRKLRRKLNSFLRRAKQPRVDKLQWEITATQGDGLTNARWELLPDNHGLAAIAAFRAADNTYWAVGRLLSNMNVSAMFILVVLAVLVPPIFLPIAVLYAWAHPARAEISVWSVDPRTREYAGPNNSFFQDENQPFFTWFPDEFIGLRRTPRQD